MTSILKIEPFAGISGDMLLAALWSLLADDAPLRELGPMLGLKQLSIRLVPAVKCHLACRQLVIEDGTRRTLRHLPDIFRIIDESALSASVRSCSKEVFNELAQAEARVHGMSVDEVHFHEIGAIDTMVDIVGCAMALDLLKPDNVYATPVRVGSGMVMAAHGVLPVPAPATQILLTDMPQFSGDVPGEMTTPTGAALLKYLRPSFKDKVLRLQKTGMGAGSKDFPHPNVLRVSCGEEHASAHDPLPYHGEEIAIIQANLDDSPGEWLGEHFQERLFHAGALDVTLAPVLMKKGRPAYQVEILVPRDHLDPVMTVLFHETTTIGARVLQATKYGLARRECQIACRYGTLAAKAVILPSGEERVRPEYESCKEAARIHGVALREVYAEAMRSQNLIS